MDHFVAQLKDRSNLSSEDVRLAGEALLSENVSDQSKERFLLALAEKGETPAEIAEFVNTFLESAVDPKISDLQLKGPTLDVCGTGGDKLGLFNVSTTAMFVAAAAGAIVVKHGNRGITSKSGGADVLEALGIRIDLPPDRFQECLQEAGVGFLFAPNYHPAFKAVVGVRQRLAASGHRTIFNLIGPLLNPARPECQLVGVADPALCPAFAEILHRLGRKRAWAVSGLAPNNRTVDELSLMGPTRICKSGSLVKANECNLSPADFGLQSCTVEELQGGDAEENATILVDILSGKETGPKSDMTIYNAAAAIACAGISKNIEEGLTIARDIIKSKAAIKKLEDLRRVAGK